MTAWTQFHDRAGYTWDLGDWIELTMHDGYIFRGILQEITPHYLIVNGYGFPIDSIREASNGLDQGE